MMRGTKTVLERCKFALKAKGKKSDEELKKYCAVISEK